MKKLISGLCAVALLLVAGANAADSSQADKDARAAIAAKFPGVKAEQIKPSPVAGVYEVGMGADTAYVSADGRYLFSGDLYEVDSRTNLTEASRNTARSKTLARLDERDMIVFGPANAKYTITVFTDVECGYCRKLHSEIDQLNKLGVRVRYMAYPRAGPGTADWSKMEAVWCSKDRNTALTKAKQGQVIQSHCGATPVAKQYELGEEFGVRGTPAIFTASGDYIGGYLAPAEMVQQLEELRVAAAKPAGAGKAASN
ncbi:MAG TPA: DsbC family protein [Povalibacter sp.]|nr:DsbC family protein [Povalibacter sp.]